MHFAKEGNLGGGGEGSSLDVSAGISRNAFTKKGSLYLYYFYRKTLLISALGFKPFNRSQEKKKAWALQCLSLIFGAV